MLLSGGVDSTVCAALVTKALGQERVIAIHIDNGFMRKNESEQVFFNVLSAPIFLKCRSAPAPW